MWFVSKPNSNFKYCMRFLLKELNSTTLLFQIENMVFGIILPSLKNNGSDKNVNKCIKEAITVGESSRKQLWGAAGDAQVYRYRSHSLRSVTIRIDVWWLALNLRLSLFTQWQWVFQHLTSQNLLTPHFEDPIYFETNFDIGGSTLNVYFKRFKVRKERVTHSC